MADAESGGGYGEGGMTKTQRRLKRLNVRFMAKPSEKGARKIARMSRAARLRLTYVQIAEVTK